MTYLSWDDTHDIRVSSAFLCSKTNQSTKRTDFHNCDKCSLCVTFSTLNVLEFDYRGVNVRYNCCENVVEVFESLTKSFERWTQLFRGHRHL